ncbi:unnamed protein product [Onchocerca flexuosa]|uniref:WD_REPEATS_REGION domain-containing protein n=1 Tax=Onchocerca flexuosa TaxID=387005 RepID=A0A183HFX7_9BILA|nr:unnamed protein product [Onchocerca flexuosa]
MPSFLYAHCIILYIIVMEKKEINVEDEESFSEEDIVHIIPLDDTTNGSAEVSDTVYGLSETEDEDMEVTEDGDVEINVSENFPNVITEADNIISACKDEAFVVACFEDRWLVVGGKDEQATLYDLQSLELVLRIDEHKDSVICAQFSVKGHLLATGDMSGLIVVSSTTDLRIYFSDFFDQN